MRSIGMYLTIGLAVASVCLGLLGLAAHAHPGVIDGTIVLEDFEGDFTWTVEGSSTDNTWQVVTETIQLYGPVEGGCPREVPNDINPDLVTLDARELDAEGKAYLTAAYTGSGALWFGNVASDTVGVGSYLDEDAQVDLTRSNCLNGGTSSAVYTGTVTSEPITITAGLAAPGLKLSFHSWWEIESVHPSSYDQMNVWLKTGKTVAAGLSSLTIHPVGRGERMRSQAVLASGEPGWVKLGTLNPTSDPTGGQDNARYGYASGTGKGGIPQWVEYEFDLTDYIYLHQDNDLEVRFEFETVDQRYNAFRGWMIDDIDLTVPLMSGYVWDCDAGKPVQGATVSIQGTTLSGETDASGFYAIFARTTGFPEGHYHVVASAEGYTDRYYDADPGTDGIQPALIERAAMQLNFTGLNCLGTGPAPTPTLTPEPTATPPPGEALVYGTVGTCGRDEPLEGARVSIQGSTLSAVTDSDGAYAISGELPEGYYYLIARADGYSERHYDGDPETTGTQPLLLGRGAVEANFTGDNCLQPHTAAEPELLLLPAVGGLATSIHVVNAGTEDTWVDAWYFGSHGGLLQVQNGGRLLAGGQTTLTPPASAAVGSWAVLVSYTEKDSPSSPVEGYTPGEPIRATVSRVGQEGSPAGAYSALKMGELADRGVQGSWPYVTYALVVHKDNNGWNSRVYLANPWPDPATVTLDYLDTRGRTVVTLPNLSVPAWGQLVAEPPTRLADGFRPGGSSPAGFVGYLRVKSTTAVGGVLDQFLGYTPEGAGMVMSGVLSSPFPAAGGTATMAFGPLVFTGYNGWESGLVLVNVGSVDAQLRVDFHSIDGTVQHAMERTLDEGEQWVMYPLDALGIPTGLVGSVSVLSEGYVDGQGIWVEPQPILAMANQLDRGASMASSYNAHRASVAARIDTGSEIWAPLAMRQAVGATLYGWSTGLQVMHAGPAGEGEAAEVELSLYEPASGAVPVYTAWMTIPPGLGRTLDLRSISLVPNGFVGTARAATDERRLAVVVNEIGDGVDQFMTYDARR